MRIALALGLLALSALASRADQTDPRLDELFSRLAAVRTAPEASDLEVRISGVWLNSGSDTVDVLMSRAVAATEAGDFAPAKRLLDEVAEMKPGYAEVWYRRAELMLVMESPEEAAADLRKAVVLEPRHFKAWVHLGRIADAAGDHATALDAYRRALALNPMLEAVARRAGQLDFEKGRKQQKPI